ncbi:RHS repeat-associated core domain-containing protein, partial [Actinacidiphila sp. bgisy160]|uniref:RHS repeat-associated core domain-containing protein n=1 Tax=Actinacidiphila sp. bgisy160 TaxID=3413796 RepID=UPI003D753801
ASTHTLYLPDTELTTDTTGAVASCQRYYSQAGAPTVMRAITRGTGDPALTAMVTDHHGTATATIALATGQAIKRQKTDPFGVPRTEDSNWRSHRGYLGGTDDTTTGLTHLGAREYDPDTGRFISADPILDIARPLSLNGYAYSANNPVTLTDPTGMDYGCGGGSCAYMNDGSSARLEDEGKHKGRQAGRRGGLGNVVVFTSNDGCGGCLSNWSPPAVDLSRAEDCSSTTGGESCTGDFAEKVVERSVRLGTAIGRLTGVPQYVNCVVTHDEADCYESGALYSAGGPAKEAALLSRAVGRTEETLAARAASKTAAKGPGGARTLARPGGSLKGVNPSGSMTNCAKCARATDLRLQGIEAVADSGDITDASELEALYGATFKPAAGPDGIAGELLRRGNGARGIVYAFDTEGSGEIVAGHFFNAVNHDGRVKFLDGQAGGYADTEWEYMDFMYTGGGKK